MSAGRDPGALLLHALAADAPPGSAIELVEMTSKPWSSATFTGARHAIRLTARDDDAVAAWLAALPEAEFRLRGHLVIDVAVVAIERRHGIAELSIEALTLEEE